MKVQNCLEIIKILNLKPKTSAQELAYILEVSTRTVYRYIEELIIAGIPINVEIGRFGGISLEKSYSKDKYKIKV